MGEHMRPDLGKILDFFRDEATAGLAARQHALLKRVAKFPAFTLRELPVVAELLDLVAARLEGLAPEPREELEMTLCKVVRVCGRPGLREKSNEELLAPGLAAAEAVLARLVALVAIEATRALHALAEGRAAEDADPRERAAAAAARQLHRRLLLKVRCVEGAAASLRGRADALLELDDDGTKKRILDAVAADVDADSDEEERGARRRARPARPASRSATPFGGALVFSTAPRTVSFADAQLLLALVRLLRELSTSAAAAAALVRAGGAATCARVLRVYLHDPVGSEAVAVAVEVLWNCLEHSHARGGVVPRRAPKGIDAAEGPRPQVAVDAAGPAAGSRTQLLARRRETNAMWHLADPEALAVLRQLLTALFVRGRRAADKRLRNEVLIVCSLVASHRRSHRHFRTQRLLHLLLEYATASELPEEVIDALHAERAGRDLADAESPPLADRHNFATGAPEDLEMKRILWALLSDLGRRDQENLELIVAADFMGALLTYLDVDALDAASVEGEGGPGAGRRRVPTTLRRLPLTQLHVLQEQAMAVLLNLAPRAPAAFQELRGHILALRFLDACDDAAGGGAPQAASGLVQGALMLLISVVGLPGLQNELGGLGAVAIMLRRFADARSGAPLRADAVQILSKLCEGHEGNQQALRRLDGVQVLVAELELYCAGRAPAGRLGRRAADAPAEPAAERVAPVVVGVIDCLWNAVVGNRRSEARLPPAHGAGPGVDALLGLLEVGPRLCRHQVCGVLGWVEINH